MKTAYVKLGWVKPEIIEKYKGITPTALMNRRNRGQIVKGVHWKKIQGVVMYHFENLDQFFEEYDDSAA